MKSSNKNVKPSKREEECLHLLSQGDDISHIALHLGLHKSTVWTYLTRLKHKYDAINLQDLMMKIHQEEKI